jgi:hypothetical protein
MREAWRVADGAMIRRFWLQSKEQVTQLFFIITPSEKSQSYVWQISHEGSACATSM